MSGLMAASDWMAGAGAVSADSCIRVQVDVFLRDGMGLI